MNDYERTLSGLENDLHKRLEALGDPVIQRLTTEISILRRSREIVQRYAGQPEIDATPTSPNLTVESKQVSNGGLTQGDAVFEMLKGGREMHLSDIFEELQKKGLNPVTKNSLSSIIAKDRRKRFKNVGNNTFKINSSNGSSTNGTSTKSVNKFPDGFSLMGATQELISKIEGEFSQPIIFQMLKDAYPQIAPLIQKASVSATLSTLKTKGKIVRTHKGIGSDPNRFKLAEKPQKA